MDRLKIKRNFWVTSVVKEEEGSYDTHKGEETNGFRGQHVYQGRGNELLVLKPNFELEVLG